VLAIVRTAASESDAIIAVWIVSHQRVWHRLAEYERLAGQRSLNRIIHVHLEDGLVDLAALRLDAAKVGDDVLVEDLVYATKAKGCLEATGEAAELGGTLVAAFALDGLERVLEAINGEAQGVREPFVEEEELEDALGCEIGGVDLAVGLEGGRGTEQTHPVEVLVLVVERVVGGPEILVVGLDEDGSCRGALDVAADLDELPSLAVAHGGVGDALELVNRLHDTLQEFGLLLGAGEQGLSVAVELVVRARDLEVETVEAVPLLGGDLLTDVAGVLAGGDDAGEDRALVRGVEGELVRERVGIAGPLDVSGIAEGEQDALPAAIGAGSALVEHEVQVDVEQTRGVLGALEVTGHPVETIGDSGEHWLTPLDWVFGLLITC
jgi:hypothetical protein